MELIIGSILVFMVILAFFSKKRNIPLIIIALITGIIFGSDVTGIIYYDNAELTKHFANIALVFVLFYGGFGTKEADLKPVIKVTLVLATFGVLLTATITGIIFSFVSGWDIKTALLLGAIISSTDAAAVFSILRTKTIKKEISSITEIESAANDPMAILTTTFLISLIVGSNAGIGTSILWVIWQLVVGVLLGILLGKVFSYIFDKIKKIDIGYYYLFVIGSILFCYGLADFLKASGMIAVFFMGYIMGNKKLPFKSGISSFLETLSFISNVGLFVLLGLLVFPKQFSSIWGLGVLVFVIITFISRPLSVFVCTLFNKFTLKERIFMSWSGIRGAVPIVLATYPIAAGIDKNSEIFNIVFFAVGLSILIQGTTIGKLASIFNLTVKSKNKPIQTMELVTILETNYDLIEVEIDKEVFSKECKISDLKLEKDVTITMINRNDKIIAPSGSIIIKPGDVLFILVQQNKIKEVTKSILSKFINQES